LLFASAHAFRWETLRVRTALAAGWQLRRGIRGPPRHRAAAGQPSTLKVATATLKRSKIADYGIIGDCRSAALVSRAGSVDWLCWPRFDSPAIFAAILDHDRGGFWSIAPTEAADTKREHVGVSNVLATTFTAANGSATLTDLMPVASESYKRNHLMPEHELIRRVECTLGEIEIEMLFRPRANYGRDSVRIRDCGRLGFRFDVGRGAFFLRSSAPMTNADDNAHLRVRLKQGEHLDFSLSYSQTAPATLPALGNEMGQRIQRSIQWWHDWAERCTYRGKYRDAVLRSASTLKLLAYSPSGAIIAAATTSLPEIPGGAANWDYRYCWLRDASFTVRSLLGLGYKDEAESFLDWLLLATRLTQPRLRVLYNVYGGHSPRERILDYLKGYLGSRPVRVGNAARHQLQLDVYGEVIDSVSQYIEDGGELDRTMQKALIGFADQVARSWRLPDEGIWEPRTGRRDNTYSKLMCWTALDRLIKLAERGAIKNAPLESYRRERENIRREIGSRAWDPRLNSYVSVLETENVDATLLLLSWYGFEPADSPRMLGTYRRVVRELRAGDGLLYRFPRNPPEGAFGVCAFWAVEHLALGGGTLEEARERFESALQYHNDLGLFSEEVSAETGEALGNFPQAYTHVGVISAALAIEERAAREGSGRAAA
jgi:GH15 family glucan-1,4-alpha-glucosidase